MPKKLSSPPFHVIAIFLLSLTNNSVNAETIDLIEINTSTVYDPFGLALSYRELVFGRPGTYYGNEGSIWQTGAGSFSEVHLSFQSMQQSGDTITYNLTPPENGAVLFYTEYDGGLFSSKGSFSLLGDSLSLVATQGSTNATLSGLLEIESNEYSNYTDSRYKFYSANVGDIVPFELTYTINNDANIGNGYGEVFWDETAFDSKFIYTVSGQIDLVSPVPIPAAVWLFGSGLFVLVGIARNK